MVAGVYGVVGRVVFVTLGVVLIVLGVVVFVLGVVLSVTYVFALFLVLINARKSLRRGVHQRIG